MNCPKCGEPSIRIDKRNITANNMILGLYGDALDSNDPKISALWHFENVRAPVIGGMTIAMNPTGRIWKHPLLTEKYFRIRYVYVCRKCNFEFDQLYS